MSSHLLSEVEQVCDWLVVIEDGRGVFSGPAVEFLGGAEPTIAVAPEHGDDLELLGRLLAAEGYDVDPDDGRLLIPVADRDARHLAAAINRLAHEHGLVLAELEQRRANLQDRYLSLVEGGIR